MTGAMRTGRGIRAPEQNCAPYPGKMTDEAGAATRESLALRELVRSHRGAFHALLSKYGATNPRMFGSVARGDAHGDSDIDILVDMDPSDGNLLMRASGLMEETRTLFGRDDIDVFPAQLLRRAISEAVLEEAVAL